MQEMIYVVQLSGTSEQLGKSTLGIGARFTTLHWDGGLAMSWLGIGLTAIRTAYHANWFMMSTQCTDNLDSVPFPFIGCDVPEGTKGRASKA